MADNLMTIGMLAQHPGGDAPVFESLDQAIEYHNVLVDQESNDGYVDNVMVFSRKGWLIYALETLCDMAGIGSLGFLYGSEAVRYEWAFVEKDGWFQWKGLILKPRDMDSVVSVISTLFEWSRQHVLEL